MKSEKYDVVRKYYNQHLWNERKLRDAVDKGWITESEFKEITGKDY